MARKMLLNLQISRTRLCAVSMPEEIATREQTNMNGSRLPALIHLTWGGLVVLTFFITMSTGYGLTHLGIFLVALAPAVIGLVAVVGRVKNAAEFELTAWILSACAAVAITGGARSSLNILFAIPVIIAFARGQTRLVMEASVFAFLGFLFTGVFVSSGLTGLTPVHLYNAPIALIGAAYVLVIFVAFTQSPISRASETELTERLRQVETERDQLAQKWARVDVEIEKVRQAVNARNAFFAQTSHELRTPLNAILGFSEVMQTQLFGPLIPKYKEYAELIHEGGRSLQVIVDDILDLSKIEAGRYEISPIELSISVASEEAVRFMEDQARRKGVTLSIMGQDMDVRGYADPRAVRQVMLNLISNGVKATPDGGKIVVSVRRVRAGALISVKDSGPGLSEALFEELKVPFAQAGDADTQRLAPKGTGLGLSIADGFMKLHGGRLFLNDSVETGTQILAFFPDKPAD